MSNPSFQSIACTFLIIAAAAVMVTAQDPKAAETGQVISGQVLIDHEFRFQLTAPESWTVLDKEKAALIAEGNIAGLESPAEQGIKALLAVHHIVDLSLGDFATAFAGSMSQSGWTSRTKTEQKIRGIETLRQTFSSETVPGMYVQVQKKKEWFYALFVHNTKGLTIEKEQVDTLFDSVRLLEGLPKLPTSAADIPDAVGPGAVIRNRKFESAAYGYGLQIPRGWTISRNSEIAADRTFELEHQALGLFLVVQPARLGKTKVESLINFMKVESVEMTGGKLSEGKASIKALGHTHPVHEITDSEKLPLLMRFGVIKLPKVALQVVMISGDFGADDEVALAELLGKLEVLTPKRIAELRSHLRQNPWRQELVTKDLSLRNGALRLFKEGMTWRSPATGTWTIDTSPSTDYPFRVFHAVDVDDDTQVMGGVFSSSKTPAEALDETMKQLEISAPYAAVAEVTLKGNKWLRRPVTWSYEGVDVEGAVYARQGETRTHVLAAFGLAGSFEAQGERAQQLVEGLEISPKLEAVVKSKKEYRDLRFGFSCGMEDVIGVTDRTPTDADADSLDLFVIREMALRIEVRHGKKHEGFQAEVRDERIRMATDLIPGVSKTPKVEEVELQGIKATRRTWQNAKMRWILQEFSRGNSHFLLMEMCEVGKKLQLDRFKLIP